MEQDTAPMSLLARQAIFDTKSKVVGYELLYRNQTTDSMAVITDFDTASRNTIVSAVCDIGIQSLVGAGCAFLNLTEQLLLSGQTTELPPKQIVIEVLETVTSSEAVRNILMSHKQKGFRIALDDFELDGPTAGLIDLADIVKVDVLGKSDEQVQAIVTHLRSICDAKLLAEKVETHEEFEFYKKIGFNYFQGFFLCKPQLVSKGTIPQNRTSILELLSVLEDTNTSLAQMEKQVRRDVALSYKLLRLLNSSMMGLRCKVDSISQATVLIGKRRLKRWATLIALSGFDKSPSELLKLALTRARMCELLAEHRGSSNTDSEFTVGLFSALDAMSGLTMQQLVSEVPLSDSIRTALVDRDGELGELLQTVLEYERGDWTNTCSHCYEDSELAASYLQAMQWADTTSASTTR